MGTERSGALSNSSLLYSHVLYFQEYLLAAVQIHREFIVVFYDSEQNLAPSD
jgi:hypothetical protein